MLRYHKEVWFPDDEKLQESISVLNSFQWKYTEHFKERVIEKLGGENLTRLGEVLRNICLKSEEVFEYYVEDDIVVKICFRIKFNDKDDLILIVGSRKQIITLYPNKIGDNHSTLHEELYEKNPMDFATVCVG